jgi:hypothetical protein
MPVTLPGPQVIVNSDGSWDLPCRLRFMNPLDIANTGVGTITVLPGDGGGDIATAIAQFVPLLGQGPNGLIPNIDDTVNLIELAPGASPPSGTPTASFAEISSGDETTPPTYRLTLYVHRGDDGATGTPLLQDLGNVVGSLVNGATVLFDALTGNWNVAAQHVTQAAACTSFTAATGTTPAATLGTAVLPTAGYARMPMPSGQCIVNPAPDGSTTIKLYARLGSTTGPIIGESVAVPGSVPYVATLVANQNAVDPANNIASGAGATVYFMAQLATGSGTAWSTTMADAAFTLLGVPVS